MSLPANRCKVVALVPHASDSAMLLCVNEPPEGPDALVLPTVDLEPEPSIPIPTVMPDDLGQLRAGDAHWIRRAMRYSAEGLHSAY